MISTEAMDSFTVRYLGGIDIFAFRVAGLLLQLEDGWRAMQTFWDRRSAGRVHGFAVVIAEVVAIALIMTTPMAADHLEGKLQALGKPEHMLSGIDVYKTTIAEVIKIYGEPTGKRDVPAEGVKDGVGGERNYTWEKKGLRLAVWTGYHNDRESGVYSVDAWGATSNDGLGKSARGLTLGSTLQQQKALYGDRFFVSSKDKDKVKSVLLEWRDGTQLAVDYDSNGRISHMQLSANVE